MTRREQRWPLWKIAAATGGCVAAGMVLIWLSRLAERAAAPPTTGPVTPVPAITFPTLLLMLALMAGILAILGLVWLGVRTREALKPPWERGGHKRRR
ncbi:MAG: hypothetical protein AB1601_00525 [Planctomycetota bacterium]